MTLSPRQTEVVSLRCGSGLLRKQIAERLGIEEQTVRCHLNNVATRTGLNGYQVCAEWGRMQAVAALRSESV